MADELQPKYVRAALLHGVNLGALGVAGAASLALLNPLPLLLAVGAELVYLGTVPALPPFKRAVERKLARKRSAAAVKVADTMLAELSPNQREHFYALRDLKERILQNYSRLGTSQIIVSSSETQIDQLLASFLRLLSTLNAYRQYLGQANRTEVERELNELVSD